MCKFLSSSKLRSKFIINKIFKKKIPLEIGYSDHTIGVNASLAAFVLGSKIIEKHFTFDNNYSKFRDHQISLDPAHMKYLVDSIRSIEKMMGKENKIVQPSEKKIFFRCEDLFILQIK